MKGFVEFPTPFPLLSDVGTISMGIEDCVRIMSIEQEVSDGVVDVDEMGEGVSDVVLCVCVCELGEHACAYDVVCDVPCDENKYDKHDDKKGDHLLT